MAITGKKRQITREFILSKISPFDIYKLYMPHKFTLNRPCRSPFSADKHPSCIIGTKFGEITFKCFNSENRGDAIAFVMQYFGISYLQALDKIASDFKLIEGKSSSIIEWETPKIITQPIFLQAVAKPYTEADKAYLAQYHLTPRDLNFCGDTKAHSTLEWSINRRKQVLKKDEVCFYYHLKNERGEWIKVYRPNAPKDIKWRSSVPFTEMMGVGNISPGCKIGIISKAIKCGAFLSKYILPCIEVVSAEDYSAITPENKKRLKESCEQLYIAFDCNKKGKEASMKLTQEMDCKHINPPDKLMDLGGDDFSDMGRIMGIEAVVDFFKQKKVI